MRTLSSADPVYGVVVKRLAIGPHGRGVRCSVHPRFHSHPSHKTPPSHVPCTSLTIPCPSPSTPSSFTFPQPQASMMSSQCTRSTTLFSAAHNLQKLEYTHDARNFPHLRQRDGGDRQRVTQRTPQPQLQPPHAPAPFLCPEKATRPTPRSEAVTRAQTAKKKNRIQNTEYSRRRQARKFLHSFSVSPPRPRLRTTGILRPQAFGTHVVGRGRGG